MVAFLAETRLGLTGFPPVYFSSVALILAIGLNTYALVKALFGGPSNCASTCGEFLIGAIFQPFRKFLFFQDFTFLVDNTVPSFTIKLI